MLIIERAKACKHEQIRGKIKGGRKERKDKEKEQSKGREQKEVPLTRGALPTVPIYLPV